MAATVKKPKADNVLERFESLSDDEKQKLAGPILKAMGINLADLLNGSKAVPLQNRPGTLRRTGNVPTPRREKRPTNGVQILPETLANGDIKCREGKRGKDDTVNYITVDGEGMFSPPVDALKAIIHEEVEAHGGWIPRHGFAPRQRFEGNSKAPQAASEGRMWAPIQTFIRIVERWNETVPQEYIKIEE